MGVFRRFHAKSLIRKALCRRPKRSSPPSILITDVAEQIDHNRWQGNCKELLEALRLIYRDRGEYDKLKDLPKTPRALNGRLKRDAPAMRSLHKIDVTVVGIGEGGGCRWGEGGNGKGQIR